MPRRADNVRLAGAGQELTEQERQELRALAELPEDQIDTADIQEQLDWSGARRGFAHGPEKQNLAVQLDRDVVAWFRRNLGPGETFESRLNAAMHEHVQRQTGMPVKP